MATLVYRFPTTGLNVQGWFSDAPSDGEGEVYETVTCAACTRVHLIATDADPNRSLVSLCLGCGLT
jgi:hypothetical protein